MLHNIATGFKARQVPPERLPAHDMMPLAALGISPAALRENFGIDFTADADDLDRYDIAALEFSPRRAAAARAVTAAILSFWYDITPTARTSQLFGLLQHQGGPAGVVDLLLPAKLAGTDDYASLVYDIAAMFNLSDPQIIWPEGFRPGAAVTARHAQLTATNNLHSQT